MRSLLLRAADSPRIERLVSRYGMRLGAQRFVPALSLDELVPVFAELNRAGMLGVTGLFDDTGNDATAVAKHSAEYRAQISRIAAEGLRANVGLKLSHLGIRFDHELMYKTTRDLVAYARDHGMKLRIDMEESHDVDDTLELFRRLRADGLDNVGIVLQSYLRRTAGDLEQLLDLRPDVRLVKGAYLEPPDVAFTNKADVDHSYRALLDRSLDKAAFTAIATHDEAIIAHAREQVRRTGLPPERYEFQMLYGIRAKLQTRLVAEGCVLRIAAPYGPTWFPYLIRRLAERPANVAFLMRNLVRG